MKSSIWLADPEEHNYPAALDYLELLVEINIAKQIVARLKKTPTIKKKSKDILRASKLNLLPRDNMHVAANLKIQEEEKIVSDSFGS